jgi:hypothetical protein
MRVCFMLLTKWHRCGMHEETKYYIPEEESPLSELQNTIPHTAWYKTMALYLETR